MRSRLSPGFRGALRARQSRVTGYDSHRKGRVSRLEGRGRRPHRCTTSNGTVSLATRACARSSAPCRLRSTLPFYPAMAGRHSPVSRLEGRGRPCTTVERDCESREGPQGVARADLGPETGRRVSDSCDRRVRATQPSLPTTKDAFLDPAMAGRHGPVSRLEGRGRPYTTVEQDCECCEAPGGPLCAGLGPETGLRVSDSCDRRVPSST